MHVRIAFQAEQFRHPYRACAAGATEVIAQQVDNHQVFRAVLGAGQQFGGVRGVLLGRQAPGASALDRAGFHMALADFDEAFRRQAEYGIAIRQVLETGKRRWARCAQCAVSGPRVTLAGCAKPLGEIDLVTVAGLNVLLDALDGLLILIGAQVGSHRGEQLEGRARLRLRLAEQFDQALTLAVGQGRVEHQLTGLRKVIADQGPAVQAEARIRQMQVITGLARQALQMSAEVVTQVTDQPTGKRQLIICRQNGFAQACQVVAQALQESIATFVGRHRQLFQWPGAEQVIATAVGAGAATVEQDGTGRMANRREIFGGVGAIGQRVYGTGQHGRGKSAIEAGWRL
ncbi:hypothetical protein D3C71_1190970 [compost metagenome]